MKATTTVGFGDITPVTEFGRVIVIALIITYLFFSFFL
jgi:hypothetical protein